MRPLISPLVISLAMISPRAFASGPPLTCRVRSSELKLARECYTGDMRGADDAAMFVGVDETSPVDLNYCFNALVVPYPAQGAGLSLLVLKDDARGQVAARTFTVSVAALAASLGRVPTNHKAQILRFAGLNAECYAKRAATDKCFKGFFGYGGTDLPFAVALENGLGGYVVRGGVRDRAVVELPGVPSVAARGTSPANQTLDWLTGQIKQKLLTRARRDLATILARGDQPTRARLSGGAGQFRFCRLAFDELNRKMKRPAAFDVAEAKVFDDLDQALREPGSAPATAISNTMAVPVAAPAPASTAAAVPKPAPAPAIAPAAPAAPPAKAAVTAPTRPRRPASTDETPSPPEATAGDESSAE